MSVSVLRPDNGSVTIEVEGVFDYKQHDAFRAAYEQLPCNDVQYTVDLARTRSLDSSALGMLLLLRDHAGDDDGHAVHLVNCNERVQETLRVACFDTLFQVD